MRQAKFYFDNAIPTFPDTIAKLTKSGGLQSGNLNAVQADNIIRDQTIARSSRDVEPAPLTPNERAMQIMAEKLLGNEDELELGDAICRARASLQCSSGDRPSNSAIRCIYNPL